MFIFCLYLVTLIPEPEKSDNVVENGVKTDKKERSNSSVDKSNTSASGQQQQQQPPPTVAKKGNIVNNLMF
jgi:hypothetical protein